MIRRPALALLLALIPGLASAQFATIGPTPLVTDNGDRLATTAWVNSFLSTGLPLASGKIFIGSAGNLATPQTMAGDCTLAASGVITCTQAAGNFQVIGNLTVGGSIIDGNGILATNIAAPATPAAGTTRIFVDSTTKTPSGKNDAGTVSNMVVASAAVANQFMTGISAAGVISRAQPALTDLSGVGTGCATWLATPSSANLRGCLTDEVGTGAAYFVGGALGTPASGTATNLTGLPVSTGVSGLGTGVATALATNVGTAGAPVINGGALGTPTSGIVAATAVTVQLPYFSASLSANQTISNNTATKINANTELADSNSWYDNVTNFRFTPQLAGKFRITGAFAITATSVTEVDVYIYKNGSLYSRQFSVSSGVSALSLDISNIVSFNGSTDYVELWCLAVGTGTISVLGSGGGISTWFEGQYVGP